MANSLSISPDLPLVGAPITVLLSPKGELPYSENLLVRKIDGARNNFFKVDFHPQKSGEAIAQFALYEPGLYQLETTNLKVPVRVYENYQVPFLVEVGFLATMTTLLLGGLILWSTRKKKNV